MSFRKQIIYGILIVSVLLMAGCSKNDEAERHSGSFDAIPIAFDCSVADSTVTRAANGYTGNITTSNNHLRYAGFGVFASQASGTAPDLMFNQEVEYIFPAEGSGLGGYWAYSPLKYWPADPVGTCFYAYAPYVPAPSSLPSGTTGIIGMSSNSDPTPSLLYARAPHPEENVDLLWCSKEITNADLSATDEGEMRPRKSKPVKMEMQHALARVKVSLGITNGASLPVASKLLVKRVTFTGNFAKTGRLDLTGTGSTPTWNNQVTENATIFIDNNPEAHPTSYGIIDEGVRYIEDLPSAWQPAGMPHTDYDAADATTKRNLLCMGDALSYLYLIPQPALSLSCVIDYCIITSEGVETDYHKTLNDGTSINIEPLEGNKTYELTLKITI